MNVENHLECGLIEPDITSRIWSSEHSYTTPEGPTCRSSKRKNSEKYEGRKKPNNRNVKSTYSNAETVEEVLEDMEEEIDQALEHRENKSKLTPTNVKNILRHIIANEYVLAMVRNTMQNSDGEELEESIYEPKLTRSKAKEMRKKQCTLPWPVSTPAKKVTKGSQQLLEEEFPEESSSDEDYKPTEEECPSEEDEISSPKTSDFGSPRCRKSSSSPVSKPAEPFSEDENALVIALPELEVPSNSTEADKIALRTRSKLCLNDTPLEAIEASFIAPDITLDMYDTFCDDEEWQEFLTELSKPIDAVTVKEQPGEEVDDGEDDPEYKVMEEDIPDYNDLRYDSSVKITRDELNALMAEILEYAQKDLSYLDDEDENKMPVENETPPVDRACIENVRVQWITKDERLQLDEQMRMYIQLLAQAYLLSHGCSNLNYLNISAKLFLDEIKMFATREMATGLKSAFYAHNLDGALKIIDEFENVRPVRERKFKLQRYTNPVVPQYIRSSIAQSKVFIYPELLPMFGFREDLERFKTTFTLPEDNLIALGLEQFSGVKKCVEHIQSLLVPSKTVEQIRFRIKNSKVKKNPLTNPIKYFHEYNKAPEFQRVIRIFDPENIKVPADYPSNVLPRWMWSYCKSPTQLPIAPSQKPKAAPQVAVVHPMISKPVPEARKLPPILPRPHVSPFKHISPILRKYSQQRRIITVLPFSTTSPHKGKPFKKMPLKPKPSEDEQSSMKTLSSEASILQQSIPVPAEAHESKRVKVAVEEAEEVVEELDLAAIPVVTSSSSTTTTTQKKQSVGKKRNRVQRDMEASLALLQPKLMANDLKKEEREALFANSYLLRATEILKGNPEVYDKFLTTLCKHHQSTRSPVELYSEIKEILKDYPSLVRDFIVFLRPEQAKECGMYQEHVALSKIREFFRKVEMHFKNQPQHISRILRTFSQLQQQVDITSGEVISALQPLLRNQSHLMEELHHLLPDAPPPDYLMTDFEVVNLPNSDDNSSIDSCEEVVIPDTPDPYGGKDCTCDCHSSSTDTRLLNKSRHCVKCGVKFIDGRIYIQTGKVLKPAQVTYLDQPPSCSEKEKVIPPSKQASDATSKATTVSDVNSKNETGKKDSTRNSALVDPIPTCSSVPIPSGSKLPYDVIEDTVFPVVVDPSTKSKPSDFSQLRDMIGSRSKEGQVGSDPNARVNQNLTWSREEDKLIIYNCQRFGMNKKAFCSSADTIGTRTAEEVEERFMKLMQTLSRELQK